MRFNLIAKRLLNYQKPFAVSFSRRLSIISALKQECAVREGNYSQSDPCPEYVDFTVCPKWEESDEAIRNIRNGVMSSMTIAPDFLSEEEENTLFNELEPVLKKMRYEFDHWDDAIHGFRETERSQWGASNDIVERAKKSAVILPEVPLPHMHVLDLDAKGFIKPHVDSVRFCGDTVAGICLLSPAVMRLRHSEKPDLFVDFLLSRRCFYIMTKSARYDFSHEIMKNELSRFKNEEITRTRRISVITRSQPDPARIK